jgi:hypothetical protein
MRDAYWVILFAILIISPCIGFSVAFYNSRVEKTITVSEKWVEGEAGVYHVTDTLGTVYIVNDEMLLLYFDSANVYAKIQPNHTYRIVAYGWRIPILSAFQNIQLVEEIK